LTICDRKIKEKFVFGCIAGRDSHNGILTESTSGVPALELNRTPFSKRDYIANGTAHRTIARLASLEL